MVPALESAGWKPALSWDYRARLLEVPARADLHGLRRSRSQLPSSESEFAVAANRVVVFLMEEEATVERAETPSVVRRWAAA